MTNQTAASPSERAVKAAQEWWDSWPSDASDEAVDKSLATLLDSFARVEVLRGRLEEAQWWESRVIPSPLEKERILTLQTQLKEAEERRC